MGHSAGDAYGKHYRKIDVEELRTVSERFEDWRNLADAGKIPETLAEAIR